METETKRLRTLLTPPAAAVADNAAVVVALVLGNIDILREILLLLDAPSHLVRAALVSKDWLRAAADPSFLRRFRARSPPRLLGFLASRFYSGGKGPAMKGSKGAELADGLVIKEQDYKLVKTRFSSFFATNLDSVLKTSGIKNLVVVGVQTPNCIRQTVFDAVALDYEKVTVIVDATAAANQEIHLE
nr:unnamed protein product [Digitaria exilis]